MNAKSICELTRYSNRKLCANPTEMCAIFPFAKQEARCSLPLARQAGQVNTALPSGMQQLGAVTYRRPALKMYHVNRTGVQCETAEKVTRKITMLARR